MNKQSLLFLASFSVIGCKQVETRNVSANLPNILFIMADDHDNDAISAYGSHLTKIAPTPNIDRIASEGMLFNHCFVTNSICAPCRATILTGKYSHLNGVIDNHTDFDGSQQTFPKLLREAGYETSLIGKWHLKSEPTGFDYWNIFPGHGQGKYYNPDMSEMGKVSEITGYVTDVVTDISLDWLKNKRDKNKPFMLMYQHKAPHRSWEPAPRHLDYLEDVNIPVPDKYYKRKTGTAAKEQEMSIFDNMGPESDLKVYPDTAAKYNLKGNHPNGARAYFKRFEKYTEQQQRKFLEHYTQRDKKLTSHFPQTTEEMNYWRYQQYMKDYLRTIKAIDENIGRVLDYLEESGLAENTIVVYTSDQGFYLGEHGWFDKRFMYEESFHTPLLIRWPGKIKPKSINNDFVMNLDFAPTFLDIAGAEIPADMQGESFLPILKGETPDNWRKSVYYHYFEYPGPHMVKRHYGIRTEKYKLIHFYYDIDEWELYDLKKDPEEMNNVFHEPEYAGIAVRLMGELEKLQIKYKDSDDLARELINKKVDSRY